VFVNYARLGAVLGLLGVAAGAFGAHALRDRLPVDLLAAFETGARYQLIHALALVLVGLALERASSRSLSLAGGLFVLGTCLFSGSLYALALSGVRLWGMVTPLGGLALLAGWLALAIGFGSGRRNHPA
jgi:uncharacterized membrane protein YgdD (TMEM256/DUF423 family)